MQYLLDTNAVIALLRLTSPSTLVPCKEISDIRLSAIVLHKLFYALTEAANSIRSGIVFGDEQHMRVQQGLGAGDRGLDDDALT